MLGCTNVFKSLSLLCDFSYDRFLNKFAENLCRNIACSNMFHIIVFANTILEMVIPCSFQHYRISALTAIVNIKGMPPLLFTVVYGTHEKCVLSCWPSHKTKQLPFILRSYPKMAILKKCMKVLSDTLPYK